MPRAYRNWCAQMRYPGREAFLFGTVQAETELEALREVERAWVSVLPHSMPSDVVMLPGTLAFVPEEGGQ